MAVGPITPDYFKGFKATFKVEDEYLVPVHAGYVFEEGTVFILVAKNNELYVWKSSNNRLSKIHDTGNILTPYIIYQLEFLHGIHIRH